MLSDKGTNIFSEIGKFFKENDATSAMNAIIDITKALRLSEKRLFGSESKCNCKLTQLQVLGLLMLFPCFMIRNAYNYGKSSLSSLFDCRKDVFYRLISNESYDWRKILATVSLQLWNKTQEDRSRESTEPVCLMVDDTDYPKRGIQTELIGKIYSHVTHSMMSELGRETVSAYAATKGGLKMLTRNICSEYGEYNIQCNGIGPGYIATPQTAPLRERQADGSRHPFDSFIAKTPAGRWLDPSELGGPAVFLASHASDAVNGHVLYVDGGILAYIGKQPK